MGKIVHIVLLKMNDGADQKVYEQWLTEGPKMQDQIPGIETIKFGPCLPSMQHRTKFTHMLYSIFESEEALKNYQTHPVHVKFQGIGGSIFSDKTVFDLEL